MSDAKFILTCCVGAGLALAIAVPLVLSSGHHAVPDAAVERTNDTPTNNVANKALAPDATPEQRDFIGGTTAIVRAQHPEMFQPSGLSESDRRAIYLAAYQAVDRAEANGIEHYDYRPEIAARFNLSQTQVNAIMSEGLMKQWPER